jgi:hypothetical protein
VDSLLTWQRACSTIGGVDACERANAWAAQGALFGMLMALAALGVCLAVLASAGGVSFAPLGLPAPTVLAGAAFLAGLIKLVLIAGHFPSYGGWIGLVLLGAVAFGGLMKLGEGRTVRRSG